MCNCDLCIKGRKITKISKNLPERDKEFLENLFHEYCILSDDATYWRMVAIGEWPGSIKSAIMTDFHTTISQG